jgi:hypothetical protein
MSAVAASAGRTKAAAAKSQDAFPVAIVVAFAFTAAAVVSCLPAGCCVDASASCPLDSASAYQRATLAS